LQYRALGRSGLNVSLISLGTGGASHFGQKTGVDDAGRKRLVDSAIEHGVNLFDTSEQYDASEELLGRALGGVPREKYLLATKWSYRPGGKLADSSALVSAVERSLRLLKTDVIDIMQFHGILPGDYEPVMERYIPTMLALRDQGKIRLIGFTEMMTQDPKHGVPLQAVTEHPQIWDVIMLKYGILNQWAAKEVLPLAEKHGVGILNMAPVRQTLTRDADRRALFDSWRADRTVDVSSLDDEKPFDWLVHGDVESVIDAGYRFAAMHNGISTVLTGTANVEHFEANVRSLSAATLPAEDYRRLLDLLGESAAKN
jgi:aryl-alcohol dehydrogenase-like predicted oxidoreductase